MLWLLCLQFSQNVKLMFKNSVFKHNLKWLKRGCAHRSPNKEFLIFKNRLYGVKELENSDDSTKYLII